ncbi:hypothetical protein [Streptomyces sp. NPDC005970]|uniref:hypothetical protein n=1 Tax=Streptomyces sp. NPDC005970 TaxID=3156723 RepID=UPI0033CB68DF
MSFDSEWSQLKADAAGQQSTHTRLNQLASAGGGGEDGGKASDPIRRADRGLAPKPGRLGRQRFRDIQDGEVAETGE